TEAAADKRILDALVERARMAPPARGFGQALLGVPEGEPAIIAEVKRRSPSRGDLAADLDPGAVAIQYAAGGAACLSVLTDSDHFGGSPEDLASAREAVSVPVLRKDFTVDARDVCDARLMGADAVLLIVAALDDLQLEDFHDLASEVGLDALVEVHDEAELERALAINARLVGVNQRDLVTFEVDTARAVRMGPLMPDGVIRVAESGIRDVADAASLLEAGYQALLVGESVVTSSDRRGAIRGLRGLGTGE
ncbi:MAG: indole-3-glycerol phosphate synthase TrpC, partial [Actinomycetota bacterium]|nr:indole-3-glycerol phosphate synthase TrpC [Actinomycetota bacterium]